MTRINTKVDLFLMNGEQSYRPLRVVLARKSLRSCDKNLVFRFNDTFLLGKTLSSG